MFGVPDGYEFIGWNTSSDGTGNFYQESNVIFIETDYSLYAQWKDLSLIEPPLDDEITDDNIDDDSLDDSDEDNDSNIDKLVIKEYINLDDFEKSGRCRCKQDAVVLNKFNDANFIYPLMRKKKLTPIENVLDFITQSGIFDLAYQLKDRNEYYLIEKENQQYFVSVSKEFIETRQLSNRVNPKKFSIGDIEYKKSPYELLK